MKTDSRIYENLGEVINLNLVRGVENTASWDGTTGVPYLEVTLDGVEMATRVLDRHHGRARNIRGYQTNGGWENRTVRNERQVSIATLDDLHSLAEDLGIGSMIVAGGREIVKFMSEALGINLVLTGGVTEHIGPGAKLFIGTPDTGAILDISEAHLPCKKPATTIARCLSVGSEAMRSSFKQIAFERRGFMAGVYSAGRICLGDQVSIQQPIDHRLRRADWRPLE